MSESSFIYQSRLANYCRTGQLESIPGISQENIVQYRRLVFNTVDDTLQNAYPLTRELLTGEEWEDLVTLFFRNHPCQSPQVWYMPKELIEFLNDNTHPLVLRYPFLPELLGFEWIEVELFMMSDQMVSAKQTGNMLKDQLIINPEHRLLCYCFPVHQKKAKEIREGDVGHYCVVAHRNSQGEVLFCGVSPAIFRLLEYLEEAPASLPELLTMFSTEFKITISEQDQLSIWEFLTNALLTGLICGYSIS